MKLCGCSRSNCNGLPAARARRGTLTAAGRGAFAIIACAALVVLTLCFFAALAASFTSVFTRAVSVASLRDVVRPALWTLKQAFFSTLIACAVGFPASFFLSQRNFAGRRLLSALSAVPLAFPALLLAVGFVAVFGRGGVVNAVFFGGTVGGAKTTFLYSFYGIITAQGFYNFPLIMKSCADAWERLPRDEKNAAVMLGAGKARVFVTITLFQLLPTILWSCALVFLFCYFSFILVLLFGAVGTTTLEVEIFYALRSASNAHKAAMLALVETAIALLLVCALEKLQKNSQKSRGQAVTVERVNMQHPLEKTAFALLVCLIFVFLLLPLASVAVKGLNPRAALPLVTSAGFLRAFGTTVFVSSACALLCAASACAFCCLLLLRNKKPPAFLRLLPVLPLAVSSIALGLGAVILVRRGNAALYVLARAALAWPLAFKQMFPYFERVPLDARKASLLFSPSKLYAIFAVLLPSARRGIASACALCFAACAADASLPLMLALSRFDTLALYTYRLAGSYRLDQACASGTALIALSALVFALADLFARGGGGGARRRHCS